VIARSRPVRKDVVFVRCVSERGTGLEPVRRFRGGEFWVEMA
jgi:hypothetical protein